MSFSLKTTVVLFCAILVSACAEERVETEERDELATRSEVAMNIETAHEQLTAKLISKPGVAGIGIGECH